MLQHAWRELSEQRDLAARCRLLSELAVLCQVLQHISCRTMHTGVCSIEMSHILGMPGASSLNRATRLHAAAAAAFFLNLLNCARLCSNVYLSLHATSTESATARLAKGSTGCALLLLLYCTRLCNVT